MPTHRSGVVSVVLVNFRGTDDTIHAVERLGEVAWPAERLQIVVVENGSGDDSYERLQSAVGDRITLVRSKENLGFAGGSNLGVKASDGEFVAFLNNDAKPHTEWISSAIARFDSSPTIGAVASKVLDWDGKNVDFVGAALTWFGMGYKPLTGEEAPLDDSPSDVLFGTGAAMFVRRAVFDQLGGFDERYFMFFEDVDFGWRLNLLGWRYTYEPHSIAYHKHHASMSSFGAFKETYLLERNALFTQYKNLGAEALSRALPATMALSVRRAVDRGGLDSQSLDLRRAGGDVEQSEPVSKDTLASIYAIDQFVENLPSLMRSRAEIQGSRIVSDDKLNRMFGTMDAPSYEGDHYLDGYTAIVDAFEPFALTEATRILVITGDPIGQKMAGPAIRAWNIAEALAVESDVTLVSLESVDPRMSAPFSLSQVKPGDEKAMRALEAEADIIVFQGLAMALFDCIRTSKKILVIDIYDPMHLEQLEQGRDLGAADWNRQVSEATAVLNEQLARGDFFLCASERQRHFYLGQLAGLGRINPVNYLDDPDLEQLIAVVPFGLSRTPPTHETNVLKGVVKGIGPDDKVVLWSGGLYNWFDPKTLIEAMGMLAKRRPNVRLFFQGTKHPHPGVPEMAIVSESRSLAGSLGLLDSVVFFNSSWVAYDERQNYLTEADAGVSTHLAHVETTFSFRTRILDYLWAELPMVLTEGDHFAQLVTERGLGETVAAQDPEALADALERVLFDEDAIATARRNIGVVREEYFWDRALAPLVQFARRPHHAPDLAAGLAAGREPRVRRNRKRYGLRHDLGLVLFYLRNGGPTVLIAKVQRRLRRSRKR